jgi:hypothetical protein
MSSAKTTVTINGRTFERRIRVETIDEGFGPCDVRSNDYTWWINGLRVDPYTFKTEIEREIAIRVERNRRTRGLQLGDSRSTPSAPKPFELTNDDRRFLRSLRIKAVDGPE